MLVVVIMIMMLYLLEFLYLSSHYSTHKTQPSLYRKAISLFVCARL